MSTSNRFESVRRPAGAFLRLGVCVLAFLAVALPASRAEARPATPASPLTVVPVVSSVVSYQLYTLALSPICLRFNGNGTTSAYLLSAPLQPFAGTYIGDPASFAAFAGTSSSLGAFSGFAVPGLALMQLRVGLIAVTAIGIPAAC